MKKLAIFAVALATILSFQSTASAGILRQIGTVVSTSLSAIKVESPVAKQLGFDLEGSSLSITNDRPFFARIIVYDKEVAVMRPGETIFGTIGQKFLGLKWEPLNPEIPILVKFYQDRSAIDRGEYLGYSNRILSFSSSNPQPRSWILSESNIQTPDGHSISSGQPEEYPGSDVQITTQEVDFPREHWNATTSVQVVNNTYLDGTILINGQVRYTLHSGEIYVITAQELGGFQGGSVNLQVIFTDSGRLTGNYSSRFFVPSAGIYAYQFVLGPRDIRR